MSKSSQSHSRGSRHRKARQELSSQLPPRDRRWQLFRILMVLLAIAAGGYFYSGGLTGQLNRWAVDAIAARDLTQAKSYLDYALRVSPTNVDSIFLEARIARRQGDVVEANRLLSLALQRGCDSRKVQRERILLAVQAGDLSEHEDQIRAWLLEPSSESAEISEAYANGLAAASRFDDAATILNAWHLDFPDDPAPLFRLGRMNEHFSDQELATDLYRQSIAIDPTYLPPRFALARILLDQKQPEQALVHFDVCAQAPQNAAGLVGAAQCYVAIGNSDTARELLNDVIDREAEAIETSYRLVEESPERFVAAAELGKLETNAGNFAEGLRWLNLALERNPRDNTARYSRAIALRGLGRIDEATAELQQVEEVKQALSQVNTMRNEINRNPDDLQTRIQLGNILIKYESERTGVFWIRSALSRDPDYQPAHQALADYYQQRARTSPEYARRARFHRSRLLDNSTRSVASGSSGGVKGNPGAKSRANQTAQEADEERNAQP
ncbi:tetratricopeptide repeat protein [Rosistilla oblonga]|uniref:tetratricopeptide repeat protein n=1 Tax=Rosistilla oblonga TaxID=2527990 RepID=UPI003A96E32A